MLGEDEVCVVGRCMVTAVDADGRVLWESPWVENLVTTAGKAFLDRRSYSTTDLPLTAIIVGDGTTAPTAGDTTLTGSANTFRQAFDATAPGGGANPATVTATGVATFYATVPNASANFTHAKIGLTNATTTALSDGVLVTELAIGPYTKTAAAAFVYAYQITIN